MQDTSQKLRYSKTPRRYKIAETCPCGKDNKNNKFAPFEGFVDKGYCHSCGVTFFPDTELPKMNDQVSATRPRRKREPLTLLPFELFEQSVNPQDLATKQVNSSLFKGLEQNKTACIPAERLAEAFSRFNIGYSGFRFSFHETDRSYISQSGAVVFWLVDELNRVRGGQVVLFDSSSPTCETLKHPERHTRPVYLAIENSMRKKQQPLPKWLEEYKAQDGNKMPCLFGLPQLKKEPVNKPIAICEAYKTALVGWIYFPEFIWLAIGSKGMLKAKRLKPVAGRSITLFPDLSSDGSTFEAWNRDASELKREIGGSWRVSRLLEDAPDLTTAERKSGDLADYLLTRCNWSDFQKVKHNSPLARLKPSTSTKAYEPIKISTPSILQSSVIAPF